MRKTISAIGLLILVSATLNAQSPYETVPGGIIAENVRIRMLSPTLVRLEYSPSRSFADSMTAVVLKRDWTPPEVSVRLQDGWILLSSEGMTLSYRAGSGPFTPGGLSIDWNTGGLAGKWAPGDTDSGNLGGISSSLDGARKGKLPRQLPGILSRSGFFVLDDSRTPLWDGAAEWIVARGDSGNQDWYFFAYGKDYKHVLNEYALLCGRIPMIPKYVLGSWATDLNYEYLPGTSMIDDYRYTDDSVRSVISRFRASGIPLDVMVLDYAWHLHGWHGSYDWSPIFPHPEEFLKWTRSRGIRVTLNDHPGYAKELVLSDRDSRAPAVKRELNIPPPQKPTITISLLGQWKFSPDSSLAGDRGDGAVRRSTIPGGRRFPPTGRGKTVGTPAMTAWRGTENGSQSRRRSAPRTSLRCSAALTTNTTYSSTGRKPVTTTPHGTRSHRQTYCRSSGKGRRI